MANSERHTIAILLENASGALSRVSGLFSARAYNIESLAVAPTEDPTVSRLTVVTTGSPQVIEQITKQLNKLVDVIKLVDLNEGPHIERELMLIKVRAASPDHRAEIKRLADIFHAQVVDITDISFTIELTGSPNRLDDFVEAVGTRHVMELARSGVLGLLKGSKALKA
ncbi:MAG: acetolactate synthase small subunit [Gammaproteobacteria bacterium]|jgi:acetolactate synthase I/III small subunit|nr:acetolactate synthase small subunit [Gammaproteobacteria bacterium]